MGLFPVSILKVKESSMEPSIRDGNYVIVNKMAYLFKQPAPGDVVVLKHPKNGLPIIKRITERLGDGKFIVAGDNVAVSQDSRHFGPIKALNIIGKVFLII